MDLRNPRTGDPRVGYRVATLPTSLIANATDVVVFDSNAAEDAKLIVRKIMIDNRTGGTRRVIISDGTDNIYFINGVPNGITTVYTEDDIPAVLVPTGRDISAQTDVSAAAPNNMWVQLEIEKITG